jgi:hypothetical protein
VTGVTTSRTAATTMIRALAKKARQSSGSRLSGPRGRMALSAVPEDGCAPSVTIAWSTIASKTLSHFDDDRQWASRPMVHRPGCDEDWGMALPT